MLVLSRETGQGVRAADGSVVGHLRDLTARLGAEHPVVARLAVGSRRRITHLVPWSAVASFERSEVQLRDIEPWEGFVIGYGEDPLEEDELLLVRDVLDTQIVDVAGHRLSRVSDVLMTRLPDGRLEVAAVEVGSGAVVRRLGLRTARRAAAPAGRGLARSAPDLRTGSRGPPRDDDGRRPPTRCARSGRTAHPARRHECRRGRPGGRTPTGRRRGRTGPPRPSAGASCWRSNRPTPRP